MTQYIRFPIETNPNQLALDVYTIRSRVREERPSRQCGWGWTFGASN